MLCLSWPLTVLVLSGTRHGALQFSDKGHDHFLHWTGRRLGDVCVCVMGGGGHDPKDPSPGSSPAHSRLSVVDE